MGRESNVSEYFSAARAGKIVRHGKAVLLALQGRRSGRVKQGF